MQPHPEPPVDLSALSLLVRRYSKPWFRIYSLAYPPLFFGTRKLYRFDAPDGEFGVLYAARDPYGAFIETFGAATGVCVVTQPELDQRGLCRVELTDPSTPLRLVDLTAHGLARMGADARLTAGQDYLQARRWAKAIHDHPSQPDGIAYTARHDPSRISAALFERAESKVRPVPMGCLGESAMSALLGQLLEHYEFGLD